MTTVPSRGCSAQRQEPIPARAGVGLKLEHCQEIVELWPEVGWFEIHAENFMEAGGPPHRYLNAIRQRYPVSVHGVGMSIGGYEPIDRRHLNRLRAVCERYEPALVSEHLAWSTHEGRFFNDLLPIPYNKGTLARVCEHIAVVQDVLDRQILIENPSTYIQFSTSTMSETGFLADMVRRTGCGLLLDVNNVLVAAKNHTFCPESYLDAFPMEHVREIHLGGHTADVDEIGSPLLIDSHASPVDEAVWALYSRVLAYRGALPTLIEWDNDVPGWAVLEAEAIRADRHLIAAEVMPDVAE